MRGRAPAVSVHALLLPVSRIGTFRDRNVLRLAVSI